MHTGQYITCSITTLHHTQHSSLKVTLPERSLSDRDVTGLDAVRYDEIDGCGLTVAVQV